MEMKVGIENLMGAMEDNVKEISWKIEKQRHKTKQCQLKYTFKSRKIISKLST